MTPRLSSLLFAIGIFACGGSHMVSDTGPRGCALRSAAGLSNLDSLAGDYLLQLTGPARSANVPLTLVAYPATWRYGEPRFLQLPDTVDPRGGMLAVYAWDSIVSWDYPYRPSSRRLYGWTTPEIRDAGIRPTGPLDSHHLGAPGVVVTSDSVLTLAPAPLGFISNAAFAHLRILRATAEGFAGEWSQGSPIRGGGTNYGTFCALRRAV